MPSLHGAPETGDCDFQPSPLPVEWSTFGECGLKPYSGAVRGWPQLPANNSVTLTVEVPIWLTPDDISAHCSVSKGIRSNKIHAAKTVITA